jgi:predicted phosphohydrolase
MKVFAISDLHLSFSSDKPMDIFGDNWTGYWEKIKIDWTSKVSDEDIVLIAGDISWAMSLENARIDFAELEKLSGRKVIIRGNHDYWWSSYSKVKAVLSKTTFAVQNNAVRIDDCLFCGTRGWTIAAEGSNEEDKKIYDRELQRLKLSLEDMKKQKKEGDKVFGLIHYPPFNVKFEGSGLLGYLRNTAFLWWSMVICTAKIAGRNRGEL